VLPVNGWQFALEQLIQIARSAGTQTTVRFTDSRTQNDLEFVVLPGGCLQYCVNGRNPRAPVRLMLLEGLTLRFPDINTTASLPLKNWEVVLEQILQLAREACIQIIVRFTDSETSNELDFFALPEGRLQYTVNGRDKRPPFRQMRFEALTVRFPDIDRSARLPNDSNDSVVNRRQTRTDSCDARLPDLDRTMKIPSESAIVRRQLRHLSKLVGIVVEEDWHASS